MGRAPSDGRPTRRASDAVRSSRHERPPSREAGLRPLVVIVDDEPDLVETVAMLIPEDRYRVVTYTSGAEFLRSLEREKPDVLVLDLVMPQPDGWEILRRMRQRGLDAVPVIVATGSGPAAMEKSLRKGAVAALMKPYGHEELIAHVERLVADRDL